MPNHRTAISQYFQKRVDCYFQAYFGDKTKGLRNTIYRCAWFPLRLTFRHTLQHLSRLRPKTVLDVGCGNGVYSLELARRGSQVTAIDMCEPMVEAAGSLMNKDPAGQRVELVCEDYLEWAGRSKRKYEALLAIGVLDYTESPEVYLQSFRDMAENCIVTFPSRSLFAALGNIIYRRHGIEAFSYSRSEIDRLLRQAGLHAVSFSKIFPGTFWVHARSINDPAASSRVSGTAREASS